MSIEKTFIITGATGGLGKATAQYLTRSRGTNVILAVRNMEQGQRLAAELGSNASAQELNLRSSESIDSFISSWNEKISGLINNAGVQIINQTRRAEEGLKETFAVNHLAALKLTSGRSLWGCNTLRAILGDLIWAIITTEVAR
jgi:NAD(P)-dependent dehydrogenase (short-subunit alcohol dehydrogenase family)